MKKNLKKIIKAWPLIKNKLDPYKKRAIEYLIWKKTILTSKQLEFLELIKVEPQITKRFYLTGGTALAEFYLKHRLSEEIDLFTDSPYAQFCHAESASWRTQDDKQLCNMSESTDN